MSLKWVFAAFGLAFAALAFAVGLVARYFAVQVRLNSPELSQYSPSEIESWSQELNASWVILQHTPWFLTGGLIALAAAVALLALRAQRAASASATASREA